MADQSEQNPVDPATKAIVQRVEPLLRPDKRQEGMQIVTALIQKSHQGPLPTPEDYGGYEAVLPGAAERILTMAESNLDHRQSLERDIFDAEHSLQSRGQWFAIIALLAMLSLIGFTFWMGQPIAGSILGGATIAAIVGMFLRSSQAQPKERPQPAAKAKPPAKRRK